MTVPWVRLHKIKCALVTAALALIVLRVTTLRTRAVLIGDEQRCKNLGANCVCSEPFNTNVIQRIEPSWFDPIDGVVKECSTGITGAPIERNDNDVFGDNNATALAALPRGNQVSYFARGAD